MPPLAYWVSFWTSWPSCGFLWQRWACSVLGGTSHVYSSIPGKVSARSNLVIVELSLSLFIGNAFASRCRYSRSQQLPCRCAIRPSTRSLWCYWPYQPPICCTKNYKCEFYDCKVVRRQQVIFNLASICSVHDKRVYRLGIRNTTILMMAIVCWINDRMFCDAWSRLNFPYLHGFWHILIFISAYTACVLFAYFFVSDERPESQPQLKYWPFNNFELGVPYVSVSCYKKLSDHI